MRRDRRAAVERKAQNDEVNRNELIAMGPEAVDAWVDSQVTDFESVKDVLKAIARAVAATTTKDKV